MSVDAFVAFDGVWKRFRRGQIHDSLRDLIPAMARRLVGRTGPELGARDFWALQELSFDVRPGEVLGIIGSNGAGKSTTLKILNHLMEPTKGIARTHGKIGSLIEVGSGFHHDLTGRQNVFLQGAIIGMRNAEIVRKYDQIVEFAGIAEFMDTPIKRYSSGMNARLGFSIAAHLEPEVLIIDEVLSVGDHAFQQKAFDKIKRIATSGVPVVLVSHQLNRVTELCTKAILLERGAVKASGAAIDCVNTYLRRDTEVPVMLLPIDAGVRIDAVAALNGETVRSGEPLSLHITGESLRASLPHHIQLAVRVIDSGSGQTVHSVMSGQRGIEMPLARPFAYQLELQMNVHPGNYYIEAFLFDLESGNVVLIGPRLDIHVLEHLAFFGSAQLNSRWLPLSGDDSVA